MSTIQPIPMRAGLAALNLDRDDQPRAQIADPEGYDEALHSLQLNARPFNLAGLGAHGKIVGVKSDIDIALVCPHPLHPRDDFKTRDHAMDVLIADIDANGQQDPIQVTPILPSDPMSVQGKAYYIVDGLRRYYAMQVLGLTEITIETVFTEDGQPLDTIGILAYYLRRAVFWKPLTTPQVLRTFLTIMDQSEGAIDLEAPLSINDLMDQFAITKATASHVYYLLNNDDGLMVTRAVAERQLGSAAAVHLLRQLHGKEQRPRLLRKIIAEIAERSDEAQHPLEQKEVLALIPATYTTPAKSPTTHIVEAKPTSFALMQRGASPDQLYTALLRDAAQLYAQLAQSDVALDPPLNKIGQLLLEYRELLEQLAPH